MVVFGGYDHYRPTMTHLLHGLLEERHNGRVTVVLGECHGLVTTLLGRKGRYEEGERYEVRQWNGVWEKRRWRWSRWHSRTTITY